MNIALIVAAGLGKRIKNYSIPKQFIRIKNKPLFIYTLENFQSNCQIDEIILIINKNYLDETLNILKEFNLENIKICFGGNSRNDSLKNGYNFLVNNFILKEDTKIITHDANRIFISHDLINKHLQKLDECECVNTFIEIQDSIFELKLNNINLMPQKNNFYFSQTPQSVNFKILKKIYENNYNNDVYDNCDLIKLAYLINVEIALVKGSKSNFKITTNEDLAYANYLINLRR